MNRRLSDEQLTHACGELLRREPAATVRQLRADLRARFGAVGKSTRLLATWQSLQPPVSTGADALVWEQRCRELERERAHLCALMASLEQRTVRSEAREVAQQDHWANQIHALREELEALRAQRGQRRGLDQVVEELRRERQRLMNRVAELEALSAGSDHSD